MAVLAVFIGIGAAYLIDAVSAGKKPESRLWTAGPAIEKTVGGQKLAIPPAWFRSADQRKEGFADQVDLLFTLPIGENGGMAEVEVGLTPRSRTQPSARLLDTVYLHKFLPRQVSGPPGLVGKPLKGTDGYEDETVWYDPLTSDPFVAKCMAPIGGGANASCVRSVQVGKRVVATYVFDASLLANWDRFDVEAGKWLARIGGLDEPGSK